MKTKTLIAYLRNYNKWCRGAVTKEPNYFYVGACIDAACDKLEELEKDKERLDWLLDEESGVNVEWPHVDKERHVIEWFDDREGIDRAMEMHFATEG